MKQTEFEDLVAAAGLNLLSKYAPRFIVSLYVPTTYGLRIQTGAITFPSERAMEVTTAGEVQAAIDEVKRRMVRASKTKQGDMVPSGEVRVKVEQKVVAPVGINYPAH